MIAHVRDIAVTASAGASTTRSAQTTIFPMQACLSRQVCALTLASSASSVSRLRPGAAPTMR